ncbi:hypothetical protein GNI_148040 [Gregarina niphandrodes]|uniref:Uncharacterized protein n=1 Tax=Gregarina niphandrodes TaxID=110365 RepID=A0A023AZP9_GRENI|nr:hypothetical protein GNI_148040 [Gregarina niphandrodes]EZG44361.1 hypothetical protein GNI_148040 [Gregarina niphandrodes]|eukprot:XP_011132676.1 hypothetical protein GNI_148040 [Gregarina niphandrodes]
MRCSRAQGLSDEFEVLLAAFVDAHGRLSGTEGCEFKRVRVEFGTLEEINNNCRSPIEVTVAVPRKECGGESGTGTRVLGLFLGESFKYEALKTEDAVEREVYSQREVYDAANQGSTEETAADEPCLPESGRKEVIRQEYNWFREPNKMELTPGSIVNQSIDPRVLREFVQLVSNQIVSNIPVRSVNDELKKKLTMQLAGDRKEELLEVANEVGSHKVKRKRYYRFTVYDPCSEEDSVSIDLACVQDDKPPVISFIETLRNAICASSRVVRERPKTVLALSIGLALAGLWYKYTPWLNVETEGVLPKTLETTIMPNTNMPNMIVTNTSMPNTTMPDMVTPNTTVPHTIMPSQIIIFENNSSSALNSTKNNTVPEVDHDRHTQKYDPAVLQTAVMNDEEGKTFGKDKSVVRFDYEDDIPDQDHVEHIRLKRYGESWISDSYEIVWEDDPPCCPPSPHRSSN